MKLDLTEDEVEHLRAVLDSFVMGQQMTQKRPSQGAYGEDYVFANKLLKFCVSYQQEEKHEES